MMMINSITLLLFSTLVFQVYGVSPDTFKAFCKSKSTGVHCTEDEKFVVFCRDAKVASFQGCDDLGCKKHKKVPDTCGTKSKQFAFRRAQSQRALRWIIGPPPKNGTMTMKLSDEDLGDKLADPSDTSVYAESKSLDSGDNSDDLIWDQLDPIPNLPRGANIYGIKVYLKIQSHQHELSKDKKTSKNVVGNVYCYLGDLELRVADKTSGNRGAPSGDVSVKRMIPTHWGLPPKGAQDPWNYQPTNKGLVYGGRLDVWDEFQDVSSIVHDMVLELDAKAGVFKDGKYVHDGDDTNEVSCFVSYAGMEVFYGVNSNADAVPYYLTLSGSGKHGTLWDYFVGKDDNGDLQQNMPPKDKDGKMWYEPGYIQEKDDWKKGKGVLGYGSSEKDADTRIHDKPFTVYFRHDFKIPNDMLIDCIEDIHLKILVDDGAIVYLNGQELWWINMDPEFAETTVNYTTPALRKVYNEDLQKIAVVPDHTLLLSGSNTIAVEVHQAHVDSSDLHFDLSTFVYNKCTDKDLGTIEPVHGITGPDRPSPTKAKADSPDPSMPDSSSPSSSSKGGVSSMQSVIIAAAIVGLCLLLAYFGWKRMTDRRRRASGGATSQGYVSYVPESSSSVELAVEATTQPSRQYDTQPELGRAAAKPQLGAKRLDHSISDWDDF